MKYAIVEISGRQFWIEAGKYYDFNRIPTELGKQITLNRILLLNDDGNVLIGQPYLESVKIKGKILLLHNTCIYLNLNSRSVRAEKINKTTQTVIP